MIKKILIKFFAKLGIDRAVKWTLMTQIMRLSTGPVSMLLMLKYLDAELQGYVYAFGSVLALSIFLELGFSQNILQFASHEFSKLHLDAKRQLQGDSEAKSRLVSLARLSFKYYSIAGLLFFVLTLFGGTWFFNTSHLTQISWQGPWLLACAASALSLIINPCWSLLEGCNQIPAVEKFRFFNSLLSFLVSVLGYVAGFALYVGPVVALISLICSCAYLIIRWNLFFRNFLSPPSSVVISWSKEIWPFQWRIGISWMSGYLLFQAVVPIVFRLAGPAEAGKYGFTMALVNVVATISSSWATSKLPQYGMFVAQRDWLSLRSLWRAATFQSLCAAFLGSAMMLSLIPLISIYLPQLEHRYAGQGITAILCACMMAQNFISSCAYVLRAFKQEPYMWLSVIGALLNFLLIIIFTNFWGTLGAACAFALCNLIMFWPSFDVFRRKQREYVQGCSLI